ncbi:hypothetical protein L6R52_18410 [Myxococcota bacterium]|nr:hypothetical protein [Myxococcota bacterium]
MFRTSVLNALAIAAALAPLAARAETTPNASKIFTADDLIAGFQAIERWQIDEARELAERALKELPDHPMTHALVAEVKLHLADYAGAKEFFRRASEAGAPDELVSSAFLAEKGLKATEGYEEVAGEHFILRYTKGKDAILVPYAFETLDKAREKFGELLGWKPPSRVTIELYPTARTLADVSTLTKAEIETSGTIALCKWNRLMVTSPRGVVFGYSWRDTIAHELAHLVIGGASANTVPIWLHEGIAKYIETAWRGDAGNGLSVEQQEMVRTAAKKGTLIPFEKMHPSMAKLKSQEETALAFAEVFTFIEFLVAKKGWAGMRDVIAKLREGKSDEQAIAEVHGKSLKALSDEWLATLKTREIRRGDAIDRTAPKVVVKDQAETPDDALHGVDKKGRRFARAADLLFARGRVKAAQKELQKAWDESRSPMISAKLASISLALGDLDSAEKAARNAIQGTQDLAGPNITLAEILAKRGKKSEALASLEHAIAVNPFDPRIHALRLQLLGDGADAKALTDAKATMALLASRPAPSKVDLGKGGLVEIDGPPFSRIYLASADGTGAPLATGMTTPAAPFEVKPGRYKLVLVPPSGREIERTVTVLERAKDGSPQRIAPDRTGT